jgi:hypothetical protein
VEGILGEGSREVALCLSCRYERHVEESVSGLLSRVAGLSPTCPDVV